MPAGSPPSPANGPGRRGNSWHAPSVSFQDSEGSDCVGIGGPLGRILEARHPTTAGRLAGVSRVGPSPPADEPGRGAPQIGRPPHASQRIPKPALSARSRPGDQVTKYRPQIDPRSLRGRPRPPSSPGLGQPPGRPSDWPQIDPRSIADPPPTPIYRSAQVARGSIASRPLRRPYRVQMDPKSTAIGLC